MTMDDDYFKGEQKRKICEKEEWKIQFFIK
jgi:hypothetical protein